MELEQEQIQEQLQDTFDTPWKNILNTYFQAFMEMCLPEIAKEIDWSKGYEPLDKELSTITKDAEIGKRLADKLMKVWLLSGNELWVLFHLEVQGQRQANFDERMYIYNYRLFDRYKKPIVSIAILADGGKTWRPASYKRSLFGCQLNFDFISIKLLDYESRQDELMKSTNPLLW